MSYDRGSPYLAKFDPITAKKKTTVSNKQINKQTDHCKLILLLKKKEVDFTSDPSLLRIEKESNYCILNIMFNGH